MFRRLFPDQQTAIRWFAYVDEHGRCRVEEFITRLPDEERGKLTARMLAWAAHGDWNANLPMLRRLQAVSPPTYEIKSHQERVLFIRCKYDAVAIDAFSKKGNEWGKREWNQYNGGKHMYEAAAAECARGPKYD